MDVDELCLKAIGFNQVTRHRWVRASRTAANLAKGVGAIPSRGATDDLLVQGVALMQLEEISFDLAQGDEFRSNSRK